MNPFVFNNTNSPMGTYLSSLRQGDDMRTSAMQRYLQQVQAQETQQRASQNAELHPMIMEDHRLQNEGKILGNQRSQQQMDIAGEEEKRKKAEAFFKKFEETGDPDLAEAYAGTPPTFKAKFASLSPQEREQLLKRWSTNRTRDEVGKQEAIGNREAQREDLRLKREKEIWRMRLDAQTQIAQMKAASSIKVAQAHAQRLPNYQQRIGQYIEQLNLSLRQAATVTDPDQKQQFLQNATALQQELDQLVMLIQQQEIIKAQGRVAGQPAIGQMTNGQVPTNPMPAPQGAPSPGGGINTPIQPQVNDPLGIRK